VRVCGISVDSTWCHDAWKAFLGLPDELLLLSDFNRDFGRAYDLLTTNAAGFRDLLKRTVFVLDRDGTIAHRWDNPDPPTIPRADDVLAEIRKLAR
jgi:glutaredoxin-dependent peroxiredoxin